jgi:hypothetical protein
VRPDSPCRGKAAIFTIRNVGGVSLLLFGSTFLWVTPMFAASDVATSGTAWAATGVLAAVTITAFSVATWGLFRRVSWWEPLAALSAVLGLATLVPYWVAANASAVANPVFDVVINAVGSAGVLLLLRVPRLEHWVHAHVSAGQ